MNMLLMDRITLGRRAAIMQQAAMDHLLSWGLDRQGGAAHAPGARDYLSVACANHEHLALAI
jgi:hypothetical protein